MQDPSDNKPEIVETDTVIDLINQERSFRGLKYGDNSYYGEPKPEPEPHYSDYSIDKHGRSSDDDLEPANYAEDDPNEA